LEPARGIVGKSCLCLLLKGEKVVADQNDHEDYRRYPRLPKEVKVEVSQLTYPLPAVPAEITRSKNISPMGLCFLSSELFATGVILTVDIYLAGWQRHKKGLAVILDNAALSRPLSVIGEVVWNSEDPTGKEHLIGIKFRDIAEDDFQAIEKAFNN
jgi:hypothetical protein